MLPDALGAGWCGRLAGRGRCALGWVLAGLAGPGSGWMRKSSHGIIFFCVSTDIHGLLICLLSNRKG